MKLTVDGIMGLDGEYSIPGGLEIITSEEYHTIKVETGIRAGEMMEEFNRGDTDAINAIAWVVLTRCGKTGVWPLLWKADITKLTFDFTDEEAEEDDVGPPVSLLPSVTPDSTSESSDTEPSGQTSNGTSDGSQTDPRPTGHRPWPTGSISDPETLAR